MCLERESKSASSARRSSRRLPQHTVLSVISFVVAGLFTACDVSSDITSSTARVLTHGVRVEGIAPVAQYSPNIFGSVFRVVPVGTRLWLNDADRNPFIHIVDESTGNVIQSVGRSGQGPGDFGQVTTLFTLRSGDSSLWVYDGSNLRMAEYSEQSFSHGKTEPLRIVELNRSDIAFMYPLNGGVLGVRARWPHYYLVMSLEGKVLGTGSPPLPGPDSIPEPQRAEAASGATTCPRWDRSGFAQVYRYISRIQSYDSLAQPQQQYSVPFAFEGAFVADSSGETVFKRVRRFYIACAFSNDYLFAVFSGKLVGLKDDDATEGNFLHVFNNAGKLVKVFSLPAPVAGIAVDAEGRTLYTVSYTQSTLAKYVVPSFKHVQ